MAADLDSNASTSAGINVLDLPDCMIEQVLECLSYDEIAKKRIVCRKLDRICQSMLNRGFFKMIRRHNQNLKTIKSQLPRRESERRNHPLAKHSDILTCIETRISMLSMTYSKYMDKELCCFIPGKVIDEVLLILGLIENTSRPLRAHEVLQELRDISSMAIEHFDENIANRLKKYISAHPNSAPAPHLNLNFPAPAFIQNDTVPTCEMISESLWSMSKYAPISTKPAKNLPPPPGPIVELYCPSPFQNSCNASRDNNASIARINHKSRKMRYDINRIDHTISTFKAEMRSMRLLLLRYSGEMKELRRRLDESETKNLELLANINQLGYGAPSVGGADSGAAASTRQCKLNNRSSTGILKRLYTETEPQISTNSSVSVSSAVVPSSSETPEKDCDTELQTDEGSGASTAKKVRFSD